jgi:putative ubiquitin-RnfH superfamily antitoxin RatB of RatAB toxin-antitoxin module
MHFANELRWLMVNVELIYVAQDQTLFHLTMDVKEGATVADVVKESGINLIHPETKDLPLGIYGKQVTSDIIPKEGDRIEFYRSLTRDPKETRRRRAHLNK